MGNDRAQSQSNRASLPREVVSLIHHVELNKKGWWNKTIDQFVVVTYWIANAPMSISNCQESLRNALRLEIDERWLKNRVQALMESRILIDTADGQLALSASAREQVDADVQDVEDLETSVQEAYVDVLRTYDPRLQAQVPWQVFHAEFLMPLILEVGAQTYALLSGLQSRQEMMAVSACRRFCDALPKELNAAFRDAVAAFLDPDNLGVRRYVLRLLSAYFCLEACQLNEADLARVVQTTSPSFRVFLDTNCLFSLLGLHDNPSNEAAGALCGVVKLLPRNVHVRLYLLPCTIEEAKRALVNHKRFFENSQVAANLLEALRAMEEAGQIEITGLMKGYLLHAARSGRAGLPPAAHFDRYIDNILAFARGRGVEVYNADLGEYKTRQDVIDDVMEQLEFERQKHGPRAKDYDRLLHDVVVWHFAQDKRPSAYDSPLDAMYWVVTEDFRFLGFDQFKRRNAGSLAPVCLHPSTLLNLLQFWVPRTPEFEHALLASVRLPFLFPDFDTTAEQGALTIIKVLGQYENVGDIPVRTVVSLAVNEALRSRVRATPDVEEQVQLIREALIEDYRAREEELRYELDAKDRGLREKEGRIDDLERRVAEADAMAARAECEVRCLKERENKRESQARTRANQRRFVLSWMLLGFVAAVCTGLAAGAGAAAYLGVDPTKGLLASVATGVWLWILIASRAGRANEALQSFWPYAFVRRVRWWASPVVAGLIANLLHALLG